MITTTNNYSRNIQKYLEIIRDSQDLSKENEAEYIEKAKNDKAYKTLLFNSHLKMVLGIARKYATHNETVEDLMQEGIKGLEHALELFKPSMKVRFNTYARYWVRAYILKHFGDNVRSFKVPPEISVRLFKLNAIIENLSKELLRAPTNKEIADESGYDENYVAFLRKYLFPHLALDSQVMNKQGETISTIGEGLTDNHRDDAQASLIRVDSINKVKEAIKLLPPKELFVINHRYGLEKANDWDGETLEEVGKRMNLTAERVRQIQLSAENRLRKIMNR